MANWPYCVFQRCPVSTEIAPYIAMVVQDAHASCNSIYRGADKERLLNKYGKASQRQLYNAFINHVPGANPANPPGFSTHELRSDGVAYPHIARGNSLEWWMQGFDVNDSDVERCKAAARRYGWELFQPYHSGLEYHHLNFRRQPKRPRRLKALARFFWLRTRLPRS